MPDISIWIEKPCPSGRLAQIDRFRIPEPGLQHLESAIWPKCGTTQNQAVRRKGDSPYSQAGNADNISILLAFNSGSISESQ